jgi:hypothetical protein
MWRICLGKYAPLLSNVSPLKFCSSFFSGTLVVESILKILAHASLNQERSAWFPYIRFGKKIVRKSFVQSRHLAVVYGSLLHGSFFVMMGLKTGYPLTFIAYVAASFSRGILTGECFYFNGEVLAINRDVHASCIVGAFVRVCRRLNHSSRCSQESLL